MQTEEICLAAVQQDGRALEYVTPKAQTEEIWLVAVRKSGHALQYVRSDLQTESMCIIAIQTDTLNNMCSEHL